MVKVVAGALVLALMFSAGAAEARGSGAIRQQRGQVVHDPDSKACDPIVIDQCMDKCMSHGNRGGKSSKVSVGQKCQRSCSAGC